MLAIKSQNPAMARSVCIYRSTRPVCRGCLLSLALAKMRPSGLCLVVQNPRVRGQRHTLKAMDPTTIRMPASAAADEREVLVLRVLSAKSLVPPESTKKVKAQVRCRAADMVKVRCAAFRAALTRHRARR